MYIHINTHMHTMYKCQYVRERVRVCVFARARTQAHTFISASHRRHFLAGISPVSELKTIACESPAQATYILRGFPSLLFFSSSQQAIAVAPVATHRHYNAPLVFRGIKTNSGKHSTGGATHRRKVTGSRDPRHRENSGG